MPMIPITAAEGERVTVRVQTKTAHHGYDERTGQPKLGWIDAKVDEFASETREFEIIEGQQRVVVESGALPMT